MKDKKLKTIALALFAMALWGSAFPVLKLTYKYFNIAPNDYYTKILIAGIRFLLSGIFVSIYMFFTKKEDFKLFRPNIKFIILIGLLSTAINYILFYIGVGNTSGIKSAIFQSTSTFLSVIFASIFLSEKMTSNKVFALILGFIGIIVTNLNKDFDLSFKLTGEGFLLINAIFTATSFILVKKHGSKIPSMVLTSGQMLSGSLILLIIGIFGSQVQLEFNLAGTILVIYSGILSALAFTIWYNLLMENPASEISMLRLFIPIFGAVFSAIVLKEPLTVYSLLGLIFVVLGVYMINKK
ncbi:MAG: DMT family transporter [Tissierellia bacterium]|nr:DMT family transporter [Tissierellia bacterium]